jgi:hypothetical protein
MTTVLQAASELASAQSGWPAVSYGAAEAPSAQGYPPGPSTNAPFFGANVAEHMLAHARTLPPEQLLAMYEEGLRARGVSILVMDTLRAALVERLNAPTTFCPDAPAGDAR